MRLDVVTIFPEYLDPLRHALLGKAIEQGIERLAGLPLQQVAQAVLGAAVGGGRLFQLTCLQHV